VVCTALLISFNGAVGFGFCMIVWHEAKAPM